MGEVTGLISYPAFEFLKVGVKGCLPYISILLSSSGEASTTGNIVNALSRYLGRKIYIVAAAVKYMSHYQRERIA